MATLTAIMNAVSTLVVALGIGCLVAGMFTAIDFPVLGSVAGTVAGLWVLTS